MRMGWLVCIGSHKGVAMTKETRLRLAYYGVVTILAFCFGRYTASFKQVQEVETKKQDQVVQVHRTVIRVKNPGGSSTTTETTDSITRSHIDESSSHIETTVPKSKTNVSGLVYVNVPKRELVPAYGISVSRELIGPITVGAFGLTNGTIGVSLGVNF